MLLKIGAFSQFAQVPVSQLRYYADIGLLEPAHIDHFTGYRYYDLLQLPRLNRILALRDLGLGLEQIKVMLRDGVNAEELRAMLRLQRAKAAQEVAEAEARLRQVENRLNQIEKEGIMPTYDITTKTTPTLTIASVREVVPLIQDVGGRFGVIFTTIDAWMKANNVQMAGPAFAQYHNEEHTEVNIDIEPTFTVDSAAPQGVYSVNGLSVNVRALPETLVASTFHHGSYDNLIEAYRALITWVVTNGWRIVGPSREIYLTLPDAAEPLTEVQYPIAKAD